MSAREFDLVVLGGGAVGENVADAAHKRGLSAAIVESQLVGGECSYWACMPSKALLRTGTAARAAVAVGMPPQELPVEKILKRRDAFTHSWDDSSQVNWMKGAGLTLIRGFGRLAGPKKVEIDRDGDKEVITAKYAVAVCTGSVASIPPIDGLRESKPWTSRDATSVKIIPKRFAIIGGGVVGCEMATAYASFGSQVTLINRGPRLLANQEDFVSDLVVKGLRGLGVDVKLGCTPTSVVRDDQDVVNLELDDGQKLSVDQVLAAAGREPANKDIGLETVGLVAGKYLETDNTLLVSRATQNAEVPWLYAVGDVNGRALLTHQGKYQARIAGDAIAARALGKAVDETPWGAHAASADAHAVPQVTFTDPEVGSVGLTAAEAKRRHMNVRVVDYNLGWVAGSSVHADGYDGQARLVIDEDKQNVIGATFVGPDAGELLHAATVAIYGPRRLSIDARIDCREWGPLCDLYEPGRRARVFPYAGRGDQVVVLTSTTIKCLLIVQEVSGSDSVVQIALPAPSFFPPSPPASPSSSPIEEKVLPQGLVALPLTPSSSTETLSTLEKDGSNFLNSVFPKLSALTASARVINDDRWQLAVLNESQLFARCVAGYADLCLRETVVDLMDRAAEDFECEGLLICLDKNDPDLAEILHSLMYVGGTLMTPDNLAYDTKNFVLVGIDI